MLKSFLPLFYFRPTICWIDDDPLFLDAIKFRFSKNHNCLTFTQPEKAIDFIKTNSSPLANLMFKRELTESEIFGIQDHYPIDVLLGNIKQIADLPNKENEIALLVTDYNMPQINGLEVCSQLNDTNIKKILLTGDASHEKAVEAFNKGLINKYIKKDQHLSSLLQTSIEDLIYEFFCFKTADLLSSIEASRPSLFSDEHFIRHFRQWLRQNDIIEFYALSKQGFLAKNNTGKIFYFVTMTDKDKNEFIRMHDESFIENSSLMKKFLDGNIIPFFGINNEPWEIESKDWYQYFYSAHTIQGREDYSWAVIPGN